MARIAYTLLLRLVSPFVWLWIWRRARRAGGDNDGGNTCPVGGMESEHLAHDHGEDRGKGEPDSEAELQLGYPDLHPASGMA